MTTIAQQRTKPKYRVCPKCEGEGKIVNPVLSVWTQGDIADDPEGFEDMLEGRYDVTCNLCYGKRVVTREDDEAYTERVADYRLRCLEDGDAEGYYGAF